MIPAWLIEELRRLKEEQKEELEELTIELPSSEPTTREDENPGYIKW